MLGTSKRLHVKLYSHFLLGLKFLMFGVVIEQTNTWTYQALLMKWAEPRRVCVTNVSLHLNNAILLG